MTDVFLLKHDNWTEKTYRSLEGHKEGGLGLGLELEVTVTLITNLTLIFAYPNPDPNPNSPFQAYPLATTVAELVSVACVQSWLL